MCGEKDKTSVELAPGAGAPPRMRGKAPINRHQAEEHVPYAETPTYPVAPAPQPAPTVSAAPQQPSTVLEVSTPSEPQTAAPEADGGVEQRRCIRCPKCGELICL